MREQRALHFNQGRGGIVRRMAKGQTERPDIWSLVLGQPEGKGLSLDEMYANSSLFMLAGTETTATLLSGVTYHLLQNPTILDKLVAEIRTTFNTPNDISIISLQQLKYLNACLQEGLRMYPPVPVGMKRQTVPEGADILGEHIPGNTRVAVTHYAAYRSTYNFHLPNSFVPERWLGDERFASDKRNVLEPFSYGPRNCLGKNLANHEMRLILTHVLYNFDLNLCDESDKWADQNVFLLWQKHQLLCTLTPARHAQL